MVSNYRTRVEEAKRSSVSGCDHRTVVMMWMIIAMCYIGAESGGTLHGPGGGCEL